MCLLSTTRAFLLFFIIIIFFFGKNNKKLRSKSSHSVKFIRNEFVIDFYLRYMFIYFTQLYFIFTRSRKFSHKINFLFTFLLNFSNTFHSSSSVHLLINSESFFQDTFFLLIESHFFARILFNCNRLNFLANKFVLVMLRAIDVDETKLTIWKLSDS
jgi:hypothetical protein